MREKASVVVVVLVILLVLAIKNEKPKEASEVSQRVEQATSQFKEKYDANKGDWQLFEKFMNSED